jgi:hypothetical protein
MTVVYQGTTGHSCSFKLDENKSFNCGVDHGHFWTQHSYYHAFRGANLTVFGSECKMKYQNTKGTI